MRLLKWLYPDSDVPIGRDDQDPAGRHLGDPNAIWRLGMMLFLASLTVLFAAGVVAYLFIRLRSPTAPPPGQIQLPLGLWISTAVLLGAGLTVHAAQRSARQGRMHTAQRWLGWTCGLSVAFIIIQTPSMMKLLATHRWALAQHHTGIYGLTFALIIIHALHVLGGLVPLGFLTYKALYNRLGHQHQPLVRACAIYWHFLEVVWVLLFGVFLIAA